MAATNWQSGRKPIHWPWGVVMVATLLGGVLVWLANLRFAIHPVMPPHPVPDYAVQAAWSLTGTITVVLIAIATLLIGSRIPQRKNAIHAAGIAAMIVVSIGCGVLAFVASAR